MNPQDKLLLNPARRVAVESDFTPEWIADVRIIIARDGHKLRAGFPVCIEVKGPRDWQPLMLPTSGIEFEGKRARDAVLRRLVEP